MTPYNEFIKKLDKIPGIDKITAQIIIAEGTTDMKKFKDAKSFAAWAGVASGNHESAGKKKRAKARKGNPALKKALVIAANGTVKKKNTFYNAKYFRLTMKTGPANKAKVAIANRMAMAIYCILSKNNVRYHEMGTARVVDEGKKIKNLINQLKSLGVEVNHCTKEKIEAVVKVSA